jgi:YidC/Oxa1 family membrane protein insertase
MHFLSQKFLKILLFIKRFTFGDMGLAIVFFAVLLKIFLFPFELKQYQVSKKTKEFEEKIKKFQKQKGNEDEIIDFFRKEKFTLFFPIINSFFQIFVFLLIFNTLKLQLSNTEPLFFLNKIDLKKPSQILAFFGAFFYFIFQFFLIKEEKNKFQKIFSFLFPFLFFFIFLSLPAGLTLFILTNLFLSAIFGKIISERYGEKRGKSEKFNRRIF